MNQSFDSSAMDAASALCPTYADQCAFLAFKLGAEEYAVAIRNVREIRGKDPLRTIANAPGFVCGEIELCGAVVPIVDLRAASGSGQDRAIATVIILSVCDRLLGLAVDGVSDVLTLPRGRVQPAPAPRFLIDSRFLAGTGRRNGRVLGLLDIERIVMESEWLSRALRVH